MLSPRNSVISGDYGGQNASVIKHNQSALAKLAISQLPREPTFRSLGYAALTRDYAILPMLGRSYWPVLALLESEYASMKHQHSIA
jgi:hypothetical protein